MKNLILLIPGNPSVPGIYDPFLHQVVEDLGVKEESKALVLPHLGQCNRRVIKKRKISVQDVIEDHKETIHNLLKEHKPQRLFIIGHSLGSAVTISLYEEFEDLADEFVVLCPFLGPSPQNTRYLKFFKNPVTRAGMKGITYSGLLHPKVSREIFQRWLGDNPFNEHIPREIRRPRYIKNFFSLVSTYFEDFEKLKIKEKVARMNPNKTFFIFAPDDYWVPEDTVQYLPSGAYYQKCPEISHDFCLRESQYRIVSQAISEHLKPKTQMS